MPLPAQVWPTHGKTELLADGAAGNRAAPRAINAASAGVRVGVNRSVLLIAWTILGELVVQALDLHGGNRGEGEGAEIETG
jgi:hypothetical protein